ncbi:MAG TPA: flagellar hook-basal body complex protein, partial [Micropepsaceae bacterium]|nr:flagellar hook-basal body complex protein [Micropepsaceae bacterium]
MRALSIAATGMQAQQTNVEVIANNLANMNTTAYKMQRAEFQDLLYQNVERPGAASADTGAVLPAGIQIGVGVRTAATYRITGQGNLAATSNPYDLAINGKGYFHVQMPDGTDAYTRAGAFSLSPEGQLVTDKGYVVAPGIAIPQDAISVTINGQGQVQALVAGQNAPQTLGQLELARFPNDGGLQATG